ncbi:hypothetical protein [Thioclava sp.]|uniref:hypothetical protein n=1 Tax=Thioclava sp. TaxID=1933450 RepID=UPI0032429456
MTSQAAYADISMRFNAWLDRFSPPRQIASNPQAMQDDANGLLRIFLDHAPSEGWQEWYQDAIRKLEAGMTTRAWPAPGEVVKACRAADIPRPSGALSGRGEAQVIGMMIEWLGKFGSQMPGYGNALRTRELIRRGVLRDVAEARTKGFALFPEDESALLHDRSQRREQGEDMAAIVGHAEWNKHIKILARLWGCSEFEARERAGGNTKAAEPDLSNNFVADRLSA